MSNSGAALDLDSPLARKGSLGLARLIVIAAILTVGAMVVAAGIPWLVAITPRWLALGAAIAFLWTLLAIFSLSVPAILIGGAWSCVSAARARRRRDRPALLRAARWVLLAATGLVAVIATEVTSAVAVRWSYQIPTLPTRLAPTTLRRANEPGRVAPPSAVDRRTSAGTPLSTTDDDGIYLVVVGESSALGEPYQPWVSVGQIVGWQLERVFPGRQITVDMRARGGFTLKQALKLMAAIKRRPDAVIVFSGHNEIQTLFGWSRNVRHYVEEGTASPLALLDSTRSLSSTATLILQTLDGFYGGTPLPRGITRELVDHPICTPHEYAFARDDFQRTLDALVAYCNRIGARPILIVPGSNDGSFEPNRSVLDGATPAAAREAFAQEFERARAAEKADPNAAIAAYRRLVFQHPEFAETHFRIGRLLVQSGAWGLANQHFVNARDLDRSPARCPTDFRESISTVARSRAAILVDGPAVLARVSPHGILDDQLYHDAHHLNLIGTSALAQEILGQLKARRAFGWPESTPLPAVDLADCVRHFQLDAEKWTKVCERSAEWFTRTAYLRFDPMGRLDLADRYGRAGRAIASGGSFPEAIPANLAPLMPFLERPRERPGQPAQGESSPGGLGSSSGGR